MSAGIPADLAKKIRMALAAIDAGVFMPDPLELLEAAAALQRCNEWQLARECERIARRCLPNLARDLS